MNREDIEIMNVSIHDTIRYAGQEFHGLEELRRVAIYGFDKDEHIGRSPYVVLVDKFYPCFDSEDYANETRFYRNFYFTTHIDKVEQICEDMKLKLDSQKRFPVLEPAYSMGKIEEHHLPYIYYHGEGDIMQIVQDRNAPERLKIISSEWEAMKRRRYSFPNPFDIDDPEPIGCLYGPAPEVLLEDERRRMERELSDSDEPEVDYTDIRNRIRDILFRKK